MTINPTLRHALTHKVRIRMRCPIYITMRQNHAHLRPSRIGLHPRALVIPVTSAALGLVFFAGALSAARAQSVEIAIARLDFHDTLLKDTYGALPAVRLQLTEYTRRYEWLGVGLGTAVAYKHREAGRFAFVSDSRSTVLFAPIYAQLLARYVFDSRLSIAAGARMGVALYRESWSADASDWDVVAERDASGAAIMLGAAVSVRFAFPRAGAAVYEYEWIGARFRRRADPGNDYQSETRNGQWHAFSLGWELPWRW